MNRPKIFFLLLVAVVVTVLSLRWSGAEGSVAPERVETQPEAQEVTTTLEDPDQERLRAFDEGVEKSLEVASELKGSAPEKPATLQVQVVALDSEEPVADVRVALDSPHSLARVLTSDASGLVVFSGIQPGRMTLCCPASGDRMAVNLEPGEIQRRRITVPVGEGLVRVLDEFGAPVPGAHVRASRLFVHEETGLLLGQTDRSGELSVIGVDRAIYVEASAVGFSDSYRKTLSSLEPVVELKMSHGGSTLRGTVLEAGTRNPMAGVLVSVGAANPLQGIPDNGVMILPPLPRKVLTDEWGGFVLNGLNLGHFAVTASSPGFGTVREQVQVHPLLNNGFTDLTLTLAPGFRVRGKVLDDTGNPVSGVTVHARDESRVRQKAQTSPQGTFEFFEFSGPPITIHARDVPIGGQAWAVVDSHDAADIEMVLGWDHVIVGRVVDFQGLPVRRALIGHWRGIPGEPGSVATTHYTNAEGQFWVYLEQVTSAVMPLAVFHSADSAFPTLMLEVKPGSRNVQVVLAADHVNPGTLLLRSKTTLRIEQLAEPQSVYYAPPQGPDSVIRVSPIPAGTYRICTGSPAESWAEWKMVTLDPGETLDLGTAPIDENR